MRIYVGVEVKRLMYIGKKYYGSVVRMYVGDEVKRLNILL